MNAYSQTLKEKLNHLISEQLFSVLDQSIEEEANAIEQIGEFLSIYQNEKNQKDTHALKEYNSSVFALIQHRHSEKPEHKLDIDYKDLHEQWDEIFEEIDPFLLQEQPSERFMLLETDSWFLKFIKFFKRAAFHFSRFPHYLLNGFRRIFKKKPKKIRYWNHRVPLLNLSKHYFKCLIVNDLKELQVNITGLYCQSFFLTKKLEEKLMIKKEGNEDPDLAEVRQILENIKGQSIILKKKLTSCIDEKAAAFESEFLKVGTVESGSRYFRDSKINKRWRDGQNDYLKKVNAWDNTLYGLFEEWRTDLELLNLKYNVEEVLTSFKKVPKDKFENEIAPKTEQIGAFIDDSRKQIEEAGDMKKCLVHLRYHAVKKLDREIIPQFSELLANKNIHSQIDRLERSIIDHLEGVSEKRVAVETDTYDLPLEDKQLNSISLNELISFEMLPQLKNDLAAMRRALFNELDDIVREVNGLDQIIIFTLTSSLNSLEKKEKDPDEIKEIVLEGFDRANERLREIREHLEASILGLNDKTDQSITAFLGNVVKLMDAENIINIRIRLTKARAIAQSEQLRKKLSNKVISWVKSIKTFSIDKFNALLTLVQPVTRIFFPGQVTSALSQEVADFLNNSQQVIDRLPLIYRRLYEIEPLEDVELFEGRVKELEVLENAYQSWKSGNFAATVVVGEKWGGVTSFVNQSCSTIKFEESVLRGEINQSFENKEELISFLSQMQDNVSFKDLEECAEYFNSSDVKRIIIIEDIQNLFLRRIDGFILLQHLFELISKTCKQVFWICTSTKYAWDYLDNVIQIQDYFNITIELGDLTNEQIINVISKRNRISGYKIVFSDEEVSSKKYNKLNEKEKQDYLKERFFYDLARYAKSNVSQALIYWLLSTREVNQNTIEIGSFHEPDLSFLSSLSSEKIHLLQALILHDGLNSNHINEVTHGDLHDSSLLLITLLEDGIIIKNETRYMVAPIVYRSVVNLLKSKNLIY